MHQVFYGTPLSPLSPDHKHAVADLVRDLQERTPGFVQDIYASADTFGSMKRWAQSWARSLRHIVILGTGGSSLGGQALYRALGQDREGPQLVFVDNIDPYGLQRALQPLALSKTGVVVISKSGKTLETMAQLLACWEIWSQETQLMKAEHFFVAVTDPGPNPLRAFAESKKLPLWTHPPHTGGRFSVWSVVGALPAYFKNVSFELFREGAADLIEAFIQSPLNHPVTQGVLWHQTHQRPQHVLMPYHDDLAAFSMWHRQLWAESLGKNGKGSTPICALGTVDQHSQLQLYLDGPADKAYTFLMYPDLAEDYEGALSSWKLKCGVQEMPEWQALEGHTLGALLHAEQKATRTCIQSKGQPIREWVIPYNDPSRFGELMAHCALEVLLLGKIWQVNPYDQPAVEMIKQETHRFLRDA